MLPDRCLGALRPLSLASIRRLLTLCALGCTPFASVAWAQDGSTQGSPSAPAPIHFQVLQSWKATAGNHSVYFNLVVPPTLPAPGSGQTPPSTPPSSDDSQTPQKKSVSLFIVATVYDHQISALRVNNTFRAYSDIDFNYLGGVQNFETDDTAYSCFVIVDNETASSLPVGDPIAAELAQVRASLPDLQTAPAGTASQYAVEDGAAKSNADAT